MAMMMLIEGVDADTVAKLHEVSRRSLTRWVTAFNEAGLDGIIDEPRSGRPRIIKDAEVSGLRNRIKSPETANVTHWTARKFHGYLKNELEKDIGYSTVVRWLHEQDFKLLVPRPWPDRQDDVKRAAYLEILREHLKDSGIEMWYADESGFEGDPRPRRRWASVGSAPTRVKNGGHIRSNVTGVVCPRTGEFCALEFSHSDAECFQHFLDEANSTLTFERATNLIVLDNASWQKAKGLKWGKFTPLYLPPYSPDFNPFEVLWLQVKNDFFADYIAKTRDELSDRIGEAMRFVFQNPETVRSWCTIKTKL